MSLKAINGELAKRGASAKLEKGNGYFYFSGGEAEGWLDRTVHAHTLGSLSVDEWIAEFERLTRVNGDILRGSAEKESKDTKRAGKKRR